MLTMHRGWWVAATALAPCLGLIPTNASGLPSAQFRDLRSGLEVPVVDGQLVVTIESRAVLSEAQRFAEVLGISVVRALDDKSFLVQLPSKKQLAKALREGGLQYRDHLGRIHNAARALIANEQIRFAEPNALMGARWGDQWQPNDHYYDDQWHFHQNQMEEAWYLEKGDADVVVAVLDSGVKMSAANYFHNSLVSPWDFVDHDSYPDDFSGHGTHTAGIIGAKSNNYYGVAGMAFNTSIMPLRVLDAEGLGTLDALISALDWAIDFGADIVNMSLSFAPGYHPGGTLEAKIAEAYAANIVLVASTGNDGVGVVAYPAAFNEVIAVGALDKSGQRASYSNWGAGLDVMAPGGLPSDDDQDGAPDAVLSISFDPADPYRQMGHWFAAGTSQAAPQVAALAALVKSWGINDATAIRDLILGECQFLGTEETRQCAAGSGYDYRHSRWEDKTSCWEPETGYGRIRADDTFKQAVALGVGVESQLGGRIADYGSIPPFFPESFFGTIVELPEGLLLLLEDESGVFAYVDSGCDSRLFEEETQGDSVYESICDIAQYQLIGWTLEELMGEEGGLITLIQNNGGLIGFLQGNGALLGSIANNGGVLGMITNNGGLLGLLAGNGGLLPLLDPLGGVLDLLADNGGLIGFLQGNGALLGAMTGNGGLVGLLHGNGGLIGLIGGNGSVVGLTDTEGQSVHGEDRVPTEIRIYWPSQ